MPVQVINGIGIAGIGTGSSSQSGGGSSPSFDTDAQSFITAASITATTQQNAVNDLVLDLKVANLWTKMKALYPMVGGTASSHKFNLKDPRDLDAAFRLNFVGGWTHSSTGALPNGTDGYANTNFNPTTNSLTATNKHVSFYSRTNNNGTGNFFGTLNTTYGPIARQSGMMYLDWPTQASCGMAASGRLTISNTSSNAMFVFNATSTAVKVFKNNSPLGTGPASSGTIPNQNILLSFGYTSCTNRFDNRETAFASIGDGLTDLESNLFYQIVEKFQYALGRNVNESKSFYFNRNYSLETNAFIFNAGLSGSTEQSAVITLVSDLKASGLWAKMKAVYPMVGGTATAHKFNLLNPVDVTSAFALTFNGGWTHTASGATPNGTDGYANTSLNPSTNLTINNTHVSMYITTNTASANRIDIAALVGSPPNSMLLISKYGDGKAYSDAYNVTTNRLSITNSDSRGFYCGSRTTQTSHKLYKNNTILATDTTSNPNSLPNSNLPIGCAISNGTLSQYSDKRFSFASIGDGLTDLESSLFYQIVEKFQVTLGRNVNATQPFYYSSGYTNETNAFVFNGGITDVTQISATNTLVSTLKTAGIWSKMKAVYPMVGGTATSHSVNLVSPGTYNLTFNGGWTHTASGATPNGTTGYADTNLVPSTNLTNNNSHISVYLRTNVNADTSDIGIQDDMGAGVVSSAFYIYPRSSNSLYSTIQTTDANRVIVLNTDSRGFYIASRTTSTSFKQYKNSSLLGSNTNTSNGTMARYSMPLGAFRYINDVGSNTYVSYSNRENAFASIGDGLTDAEATTFYNAVQAFQTTLGRQV